MFRFDSDTPAECVNFILNEGPTGFIGYDAYRADASRGKDGLVLFGDGSRVSRRGRLCVKGQELARANAFQRSLSGQQSALSTLD